MTVGSGSIWVKDPDEFVVAVREHEAGSPFPVLEPPEEWRRARWRRVVNWYEAGAERNASGVEQRAPSRDDRGIVAAIGSPGDVSVFGAQLLAETTGRRFQLHPSCSALVNALDSARAESVVVVGIADAFPRRSLSWMAERFEVPWGVITAQDHPGVSFVLAKLALQSRAVIGFDRWGTLDFHKQRLRTWEGNDERESQLNSMLAVSPTLTSKNWSGLALSAHGEGGHSDLDSVVLCGLLGDVERTTDGVVFEGCTASAELRRCKRSPDHAAVLAYGDVHAILLGLFSCSSALIVPELYPSNVSGVLSAVDGFPCSVVATDRLVAVDSGEVDLAWRMLRAGSCLVAVLQAINDVQERQIGARPYVLFGDPTATPVPSSLLGTTRQTGVRDVALGRPDSVVEFAASTRSSCQLLVGARRAFIVPSSDGAADELDLVDRTADVSAAREQICRLARHLPAVRNLQQALAHHALSMESEEEQINSQVSVLTVLRIQLEDVIQSGFRLCDRVSLSGHWDPLLAQLLETCDRYVALWTYRVAELLRAAQGWPIHDLLVDGLSTESVSSGESCSYCTGKIAIARYRSPTGDQPDWLRADCPICGVGEVWSEGSARLSIGLLEPLVRHERAEVRVVVTDDRVGLGDHPSLLVVALYDRGQGRDWFRKILPVDGGTTTVVIPEHPSLLSELHRLTVTWVHGLDITLSARRWPAGINVRSDSL